MQTSPVSVQATYPQAFSRAQLVLRLLIFVTFGAIGIHASPFALVYLGLPVAVAVLLSVHPRERFVDEDTPRLTAAVTWLVRLSAYFMLVSDELPGDNATPLQIRLTTSGTPSVGSALLRLLSGIPSALVLMLVGVVSSVVMLIAGLWILIAARYPRPLWEFQLGALRWQARLIAYLSSLVAEYPPFALDTSHDDEAPGQVGRTAVS